MSWELPSPRVRELIRQGAEVALHAPAEWLEELDEATLAGDNMQVIAADPVLSASTRRTNRANLLHWAAANVRDPGAPVAANLGPEPLAIARDLVRRGLNEWALDSYRVGENVAWRRWMELAFGLTSDPEELRELLDVSSRSISAFIDATVTGISAQMELEREELTRGSHAERREVVALLLDGAPIARKRAEDRLGYDLGRSHTAAVVWSDDPGSDLRRLDQAAEALARATGEAHALTVMASAATRWVWVHGRPDLEALRAAVGAMPTVRLALGSTASGLDGFRRSHLDALTTQRMLARLSSTEPLATYEEVELASLVTQDPERAEQFVRRTLGALETGPAELRATVLAFLGEQCNASRAAARLYTHRNTLLRRLARADELLPRPLAENALQVGVALEIVRWRGSALA
jgi:DNA-binding PucR family transcriptional regulator